MKNLISIIMPLNEVESYINESIESVRKQTYKNIELLIIKEYSDENIDKIINYHAKQDNRIRIITKTTRSIENLKNIGIQESQGKFITFMESGDQIENEFIETLIKIQNENNVDIVVTELIENKPIKKTSSIEIFRSSEIMEAYLNLKIRSYAKGKLFKKELFKEIDYPPTYYDNFLTTYKIFDEAKSLAYSNVKLYKFIEEKNKIISNEEHMNKINGCFNMLSFIETNYPHLINACKTKICFEAIDLFKKVDDKIYQKQLYEYIKLYRPYAIKDLRLSAKVKIQVIKTLLGFNVLRAYLKLDK